MNKDINALIKDFYKHDYILNEELATSVFLLKNLEKPLLLEGNPGVGKTMLAKSLADQMGTQLIRLQCYEGLDVNTTIYEWNYQKQLLHIKLFEKDKDRKALGNQIFGMDYVLKRPLLQSISSKVPVVLLIDEIDRADEEFEAYLLELLSDFQISIPELGIKKEFVSNDIGSQSAIAGGGRYDKLVEYLDGKPTPAVGFAIGIERIMELVQMPGLVLLLSLELLRCRFWLKVFH